MRLTVLEGLADSVLKIQKIKRAELCPWRGSLPGTSLSSLAPLHRSDTDLSAAGLGAALARAVAPARLAAAGFLVVFASLLAVATAAQSKETKYFVVVEAANGSFALGGIGSGDEDPDKASEWSINDSRLFRTFNSASWTTSTTQVTGIKISGTVRNSAPSTAAALSGLTPEDSDGNTITLSPTFPSDTTTDYTAADGPPVLTQLALPEGEAGGWGFYPAFDPAIRHYALRCGYRDSLSLRLAAPDDATLLTVNGQPVDRDGEAVLTNLVGDSDIVIRLCCGDTASSYVLHCLADDFPEIEATSRPGVSDGLILVSVWMQDEAKAYFSWIAMIDNNGVPRFRRRIDRLVNSFKPQRNARFPFSYGREAGHSENPRDDSWRSYEFVLLDRALELRRVVRTVAPLTHTDIHDFVVRGNGNVVLIAYEPAQRDLSAIGKPDGAPYGTAEAVEDSVIQEVAPDGREVFRWNSWDHLAAEDCTQHRFPWDYAHLNSLQIVDGDIVASFRGCSQVLRIDGETGAVAWRLGRSNRDWPHPSLAILGDPHGEFCGQHSARLMPDGRLLLFDNGGHCQVDPSTGRAWREGGWFSRVVEYALDPEAGTATFLRHHGLHGAFDRHTRAWGNVQALANGNWLIGWGRGGLPEETPPPPDVTLTEIDPGTGEELLVVRIGHDGRLLSSQAYRVGFEALEGASR